MTNLLKAIIFDQQSFPDFSLLYIICAKNRRDERNKFGTRYDASWWEEDEEEEEEEDEDEEDALLMSWEPSRMFAELLLARFTG